MDRVAPLHSDFVAAGHQPYVFNAAEAGLCSEEDFTTMAYVVLTRRQGLLFALPMDALSGQVLTGGTADLVGPHLNVQVPASLLAEDSPLMEPVPIEDHKIEAVLVDFSTDVVVHLIAVTSPEDLPGVLAFDVTDLSAVPTPSVLVSSALSWSLDMAGGVPDRIQYHSADEVPEIPAGGDEDGPSNQPLSPPGPRRRAPSGPTPKGANAWLHLWPRI